MGKNTASTSDIESRPEMDPRLKAFIESDNNIKDQILILKKEIKDDSIDKIVEEEFDKFMKMTAKEYGELFKDNNLSEADFKAMEDGFNGFLQGLFQKDNRLNYVFEKLKAYDTLSTIRDIRFELNRLAIDTETSNLEKSIWHGDDSGYRKNKETDEIQESLASHDFDADHIDAYETKDYAYASEEREDIYSDKKMKRTMEKIFEENEIEEIKKGTFGVNMSRQDGLVEIIEAINKNKIPGVFPTTDDPPKIQIEEIIDEKTTIRDITYKDIKERKKADLIKYKREKGLKGIDTEYRKMAKILSRASRKDLAAFASLSGARIDQVRVAKERSNAKELVESVSEDDVFAYLCDFDSDGTLGGDYGNVFGSQVFFTIEQAIDVLEVTMGKGQGENIVIQNLIRNIDIADARTMLAFPGPATKADLLKFLQDHPESKAFFTAAIEKMNGGSHVLTPDLYDSLTGKDIEAFLENQELTTEQQLRKAIDKALDSDPALQRFVAERGKIEVREDVFHAIMNVLDYTEISITDDSTGDLADTGLRKDFIRNAKQTLLTNVIQNSISFVLGAIHGDSGSLRLMIGIGESGTSYTGRTKRGRNLAAGPKIEKGGYVSIMIGRGAEIAEQYNYNRVIDAQLDKVASAKYVGIEGGALAAIKPSDRGASGVEAYAGLEWLQDPVVGIEQINRQYESVSNIIFQVNGDEYADIASGTSLEIILESKINNKTKNHLYGKFIQNNVTNLGYDARRISEFMSSNKVIEKIQKQHPDDTSKQIEAFNELMGIIQDGNIQQRRGDLLMALQDKIDVTKLSFGVTTMSFLLGAKSAGAGTKPQTGGGTNGGMTLDDTPIVTGGGEEETPATGTTGTSAPEAQERRFGFSHFYIGAKISAWQNTYLPNAGQLAQTGHEISKGVGEQLLLSEANLPAYAAYLEALFQLPGLSITAADKKIIVEYSGDSPLPLYKLLNIHYTEAVKDKFILEDKKLIIGDIKEIGSYTVALPNGVDRILCLGSKSLEGPQRVGIQQAFATDPEKIGKIEDRQEGYKELTKAQIDAAIDALTFEGTAIPDPDKEKIKNLFLDEKFTTGTLTITKTAVGEYEFNVDYDTPPDKLDIKYIDTTDPKIIEGRDTTPTDCFKAGEKLMDYDLTKNLSRAKEILDRLDLDTIAGIESQNNNPKPEFEKFMKAIMADDFSKAKTFLAQILSDSQYSNIRTLLKSEDRYVSTYVVDRWLALFAYEKIYQGQTISKIFSPRGDAAGELTGPSKEDLPDEIKQEIKTFKKTYIDRYATTKYEDIPREKSQDIIGYVSFYRRGVDRSGQGYALTGMGGDINVAKDGIEGFQNDTQAKTWIINNLKKNETESKFLLESIKAQLPEDYQSLVTLDDLWELVLAGEKIVEGALDKNYKKVIVTSRSIFYFLAECINESIGLQFESIKTETKTFTHTEEDKIYEGGAVPEKNYVPGIDIFGKSHSVAGKPSAQGKSVGAKAYKGVDRTGSSGKQADNDGTKIQTAGGVTL